MSQMGLSTQVYDGGIRRLVSTVLWVGPSVRYKWLDFPTCDALQAVSDLTLE